MAVAALAASPASRERLAALVRDGTVHVSEAYRKALEKESLLAALKREGIDTSFAERLA